MSDSSPQRDLEIIQRWFSAVVMHPEGVESGAESETAQRIIRMKRDELERVVRRSKNLTAAERMGIYANAYYARLIEVMRNTFPVLVRTLGQEIFDDFAFEYLQGHPSQTYTLDHLADGFTDYLRATRPSDDEDAALASWADFLIDLATLEYTIAKVFDGPGIEKSKTLTSDDLLAITPASWPDARLEPAPCLRLCRFDYPVNAYWSQMHAKPQVHPEQHDGSPIEAENDVPMPDREPEYVAITRRDYVVRRYPVGEAEHTLLTALVRGDTVGQAIEHTAQLSALEDEALAAELKHWFGQWAAGQLFVAIRL